MSELETLSVSDLASWLDTLQETISCKVIVIYDACHSGSFLPALTAPPGSERIVITSSDSDEAAYFNTQGSISFSSYFWTHIFNGTNMYNAFDLAKQAVRITPPYQKPQLDDNGDGVGNEGDRDLAIETYIGNGTRIIDEAPFIEEVSPDQTIVGTSLCFTLCRWWSLMKTAFHVCGQ